MIGRNSLYKYKYTIADCHKLAEKHNGKFLSSEYLRANDSYMWKCRNPEHPIFNKSFSKARLGQWCPKCKYEKISNTLSGKNTKNGDIYNIDYCKKISNKLDIICHSTEYKNLKSKMKWECKNCGYKWEASFASIKTYKNKGCPHCKKVRITEEDLLNMAHNWGGEYLNKKYKNSLEPLRWKCRDGHIFYLPWETVKSGRWCPICNSFVGEEISRGILNRIFGTNFVKKRIIKTDKTKVPLELDGYCSANRIAFEYQGLQHYKYVEHFHKTTEDYEKRLEYDEIKEKWCKQNNIKLIVILDFIKYDNLNRMIEIIEDAIKKAELDIPTYTKPNKISEIYKSNVNELKKICEGNGGKLITDTFLGWSQKHEFECNNGHRWQTSAYSVKHGSWCKKCKSIENGLKLRKYTYKDAKKIAEKRDGICLSKYKTFCNDTQLTWYCNKHEKEWKAPISRIINGAWCPSCGREKSDNNRRAYTIEDLNEFATKKGGKCLSNKYTRADNKYLWECSKGHQWETTFNEIKGSSKHKATWCPYCSGKAKKTIEDMQELAIKNNGICLSNEYIGAFKHLLWKCECGHEFKAMPTNVQQGKWCPKCKGKKGWATRRKK